MTWLGAEAGEGVTLTDDGMRLMTEHLLSKKGAALIDALRLCVQVDVMGEQLGAPADDLTEIVAGELAAYISELESIKAAS